MEFANKEYLFLLLLIIPYAVWYVMFRKKSEPTIQIADTYVFRFTKRSWRVMLMPVQLFLRILAFTMLVVALARPQTHDSMQNENIEGIDIMLAMDVSTSMLAEDLRDDSRHIQNRIEAAKAVAAEFIAGRPNDNIGLTIFAGEAFTQCPMTIDHASLLSLLHNVRTDIAARGLIEDGTAIGMGIANALTRLKDSKAKSKVIILLTDGTNNRGQISPNTAAEIAKSFGIRVYTIGVGTNGTARYPMPVAGHIEYINVPVEIDTKTLATIAKKTDGEFYRATNTQKLFEVYKEIDKLEKTKMNVKKYSKKYEAFGIFILLSLLSLILELLLRNTYLQRIP